MEVWTPAEVLRRAARLRKHTRREFVAAAELALIGLERPTANGARWWADEPLPDELAAELMEGVPE